jgi:hypothetical protein
VPFGYNAHQQRLRSNLSGLEQSLGVKPVMYGQSAAAAAAAAAAHGVRFTEAPNNITPAQARGLALAVADRPQDRSPSNARPTPHPRTPDYGTGMLQQQLQEVRGALEAERTITSRLTARLAEATADAAARTLQCERGPRGIGGSVRGRGDACGGVAAGGRA